MKSQKQAPNQVPIFILAGGLGTRFSEETGLKPKPMIEIGDTPILIHIMRWYYSHGFNDFVICAGYRSWEIKDYFLDYEFRKNHLVIDHRTSENSPARMLGQNSEQEKWRVRVVDTGLETMTGARLAKAFDFIQEQESFETFGLTYGDGLSDVDLKRELAFHQEHGKAATLLGVKPLARFGELDVNRAGKVASFLEKPQSKQGYINGGFFFLNREFRKYLKTDPSCILEREPLSGAAQDSELMMFEHLGFWQPMDTLRDKNHLQSLWESGKAAWLPKSSQA